MSLLGDRKLRLADRYELEEGGLYLSGLQALVRIPIDQHRLDQRHGLRTATLISGYEGSPLAGYDLEIGRQRKLLAENGVVHRPAVNEELGADAVQGSQLASAAPDKTCDGVIGIWYGKAPGLDRATDALRHGNLGGADATGGVLILVGDDSIAKSSTVPSSSEMAMAARTGPPVRGGEPPQRDRRGCPGPGGGGRGRRQLPGRPAGPADDRHRAWRAGQLRRPGPQARHGLPAGARDRAGIRARPGRDRGRGGETGVHRAGPERPALRAARRAADQRPPDPRGAPMLRPTGDLPPDVIARALAPRIIAHLDQPGRPRVAGRPAGRAAAPGTAPDRRPDAVLLLGMPAQPGGPAAGGLARRRGDRLLDAGGADARGAVREHHRLHPDGRRGRAWVGMEPFVTRST